MTVFLVRKDQYLIQSSSSPRVQIRRRSCRKECKAASLLQPAHQKHPNDSWLNALLMERQTLIGVNLTRKVRPLRVDGNGI